jgi:RNA-directed DNA polymerase
VLPGLCYSYNMSRNRRQSRPPEWPDWFEPKGYIHFDRRINDPESVRKLVESPESVARHAFLPQIHFKKIKRKFKRDTGTFVKKPRPLSYASHTDSQIFRHYCQVLSWKYEEYIAKCEIGTSVLAYRRFEPPKCNIHFANEAFRFIEQNAPCVALAYDVKDFFEEIDHKRLKVLWKAVLDVGELPPDHYAIFKAVTRYSWVDRDRLFQLFGITKKKQANWRGPVCSPREFREKVRTKERSRGLIQVNTRGKGIPQGSPISALLSNIYMIPVDVRMAALAQNHHALYLRYSDDILIVCNRSDRKQFEHELQHQASAVALELHDGPGKTTVATFTPNGGDTLDSDRPLQYLGFTFDGRNVRVRSQTVARYMQRMRKAIRREKHLAQHRTDENGDCRVRRKLLYSRYSHLGSKNFISYANKAKGLFDRNAIQKQIKHHWQELHAMLLLQ